jgi:CBS domain-containing protein
MLTWHEMLKVEIDGMKISEIMKQDFLCLEYDDTLSFAAKKLVDANLSEAPVVRQRKFVGMFLTSDLAAALVKTGIFGQASTADANKVKNDVVGKHFRSTRTWLAPDADLLSALLLLVHRNVDVIPVLDKEKKIIGIVNVADVRREIAKMLSAGGKIPVRTPENLQEMELLGGKTAIDHIVHYVQEKGTAGAEEVAKKCGLTVDEVEEYANSLEKNGLLKLEYTMFGKLKLHRPE